LSASDQTQANEVTVQATAKYLTTPNAASYLGLSPRTLEKFRVVGGGPAFHKFGRRVLYSYEDLETWAEGTRRRSTSDRGEVDNG
jgi:excisionase family DNA binding protein